MDLLRLEHSHQNIQSYYEAMVGKARLYVSRKQFDKAMRYIETSSRLQYNYNRIYTDDRVESLLREVSKEVLLRSDQRPSKNRYVFYDAFGWENRGLTQQYLDALLQLNSDILFVFENYSDLYGKSIYDKLIKFDKVTILKLDGKLSVMQQLDELYSSLMAFAPSAIFLHLAPWSYLPLIVSHAFPNIPKYQINLTDHAYWLGAGIVDYVFEFRLFGVTLSQEKRKIKTNQQLLLPYYPIMDDVEFEGFPIDVTNKIVVFSGGSSYKICSDDNLFFELVKILLEIDKRVVFFYAGIGDFKSFERFIIDNNYSSRIFLLGFRKDINELFRHSDIYLSTYPFIGGLMSQYAASNALPILAYSNGKREVESVVCINGSNNISLFTLEDFERKARKMILDDQFRKQEGTLNKTLVVNEELFNKDFAQLLDLKCSNRPLSKIDIDYDSICDWYLSVMNKPSNNIVESLLYKTMGLQVVKFPKVFMNIIRLSLIKIFKSFK